MGSDPRAIRLGGVYSNAWLLLGFPDGPMMVDSGFPWAWRGVLRGLRQAGLEPNGLVAVLLTHRHCDHAGNAARFAEAGASLHAHPHDAAILQRVRSAPDLHAGPSLAGMMSAFENRFPARPCDPTAVRDGDVLPGGLEVIEAPGHTAGSICFFHRQLGWLFCGDALLNAVPPLAQRIAITLPYAPYCDDHAQALRSVRRLVQRAGQAQRTFTGHGPPIEGPLHRAVTPLL